MGTAQVPCVQPDVVRRRRFRQRFVLPAVAAHEQQVSAGGQVPPWVDVLCGLFARPFRSPGFRSPGFAGCLDQAQPDAGPVGFLQPFFVGAASQLRADARDLFQAIPGTGDASGHFIPAVPGLAGLPEVPPGVLRRRQIGLHGYDDFLPATAEVVFDHGFRRPRFQPGQVRGDQFAEPAVFFFLLHVNQILSQVLRQAFQAPDLIAQGPLHLLQPLHERFFSHSFFIETFRGDADGFVVFYLRSGQGTDRDRGKDAGPAVPRSSDAGCPVPCPDDLYKLFQALPGPDDAVLRIRVRETLRVRQVRPGQDLHGHIFGQARERGGQMTRQFLGGLQRFQAVRLGQQFARGFAERRFIHRRRERVGLAGDQRPLRAPDAPEGLQDDLVRLGNEDHDAPVTDEFGDQAIPAGTRRRPAPAMELHHPFERRCVDLLQHAGNEMVPQRGEHRG